jgi:prostatic aicd phosphatase
MGFWQGMFPPSSTATLQTLANGTTESTPLDGYQYVTLNALPSTDPGIIQIAGDQTCPTYTVASEAYYNSTTFLGLQPQLQPFYNKFKPLLAGYFTDSQIGFQNAYNIFDYINVGYIHNATIYNNVAWDDLYQLRTLADQQSFDLNYNASSPNASIGGMAIAGSVLSRLNQTVSQSSPNLKVTYFVGAYSPQMAFWALMGLQNASTNFTGLPDYASASVFELRRPAGSTGFDDLSVRFGFRNGTNATSEVNYFPMFNYNSTDMPWSDWSSAMSKISISSDATWCNMCNSSLVFCTGSGKSTSSATPATGSAPQSSSSSSGLSNAAAGGIGAGVTIGVIAIIEGLVALWYFSSRKRTRASAAEKIPSN